MRMAMKAKMAADKENQRAEKRHQEVCLRGVISFIYRNNAFCMSKKKCLPLCRAYKKMIEETCNAIMIQYQIRWPVAVLIQRNDPWGGQWLKVLLRLDLCRFLESLVTTFTLAYRMNDCIIDNCRLGVVRLQSSFISLPNPLGLFALPSGQALFWNYINKQTNKISNKRVYVTAR